MATVIAPDTVTTFEVYRGDGSRPRSAIVEYMPPPACPQLGVQSDTSVPAGISSPSGSSDIVTPAATSSRIWAIGTGRTASADDAGDMCTFVREQVRGIAGDAADSTRVLYGGSANPGNIAGLMAKKDIDGGLVGGASLDPDSFAAIVAAGAVYRPLSDTVVDTHVWWSEQTAERRENARLRAAVRSISNQYFSITEQISQGSD